LAALPAATPATAAASAATAAAAAARARPRAAAADVGAAALAALPPASLVVWHSRVLSSMAGNLEDEDGLALLRQWKGFETSPKLKSKLKKVLATKRSSCPLEMRDAVTDLLRRCLCCEPSYRLEMQEVLEHKLLAQMAWPREVKQRRQLPLPPDGKSHFFVSKHERYKHLAMDMYKGLTEDG